MKRLRLEDLEVESFSTTGETGGRGTVQGFLLATDPDAGAPEGALKTDEWSCQYTCDLDKYPECRDQSFTCVNNTCKRSCQICDEV